MPGARSPDQQEGWPRLRTVHGARQMGSPPERRGDGAREEALQMPFGEGNHLRQTLARMLPGTCTRRGLATGRRHGLASADT